MYVRFFLSGFRMSTMDDRIGISTKIPFRKLLNDLSTPKRSWDMTDWVYVWWCCCWLLLMDWLKLDFLNVHFFLFGFRTRIMDGKIVISANFPFRTKKMWPSCSLWLKRYGYFKNCYFKIGVCLYSQYVSCINILSRTSSTFQYQILHHKLILKWQIYFLLMK